MMCENCGSGYLIFGWSCGGSHGSFDDRCTVQAAVPEIQGSEAQDPHKLGFPMGYHSWKHCLDILDFFLKKNWRWTTQLTFDDWAVCRTMMVRIIAVNEDPEWVSRDPANCIYSLADPMKIVFVKTLVPMWPPAGDYTQAYCQYLGRFIDNPRREGVHYHVVRPEAWVDVGVDAFNDDAYFETGGLHQNRPPLYMSRFTEFYFEEARVDNDGVERAIYRVPLEVGPGSNPSSGPGPYRAEPFRPHLRPAGGHISTSPVGYSRLSDAENLTPGSDSGSGTRDSSDITMGSNITMGSTTR